jgi:hypothetical protein
MMVHAGLLRLSLLAVIVIVWSTSFGPESLAAAERNNIFSADQEIIGTWKLASIYEEDEQGYEVNQFGDGVIGEVIVGKGDNFSLQIMSPSARRYTPRSPSCVAAAGLVDAITYFGTYSIDSQTKKLTLHIENCLFRKCDGTNPTISINILDDKMEWISAGVPSATGAAYSDIVWRRACCSLHH